MELSSEATQFRKRFRYVSWIDLFLTIVKVVVVGVAILVGSAELGKHDYSSDNSNTPVLDYILGNDGLTYSKSGGEANADETIKWILWMVVLLFAFSSTVQLAGNIALILAAVTLEPNVALLLTAIWRWITIFILILDGLWLFHSGKWINLLYLPIGMARIKIILVVREIETQLRGMSLIASLFMGRGIIATRLVEEGEEGNESQEENGPQS